MSGFGSGSVELPRDLKNSTVTLYLSAGYPKTMIYTGCFAWVEGGEVGATPRREDENGD